MEAIELPLHRSFDDVSGSIRIVPYRLKANSSQAGLDEPLLWNMNFFVETPWWYRAGQSEVLAACELQIGDAEVIDGLRGNHVPYERARILDALPLLRAALEGLPADDAADYEKINARLRHERTLELVCGGTVAQALPSARRLRADAHRLRGTIINNAHFRAFAGWARTRARSRRWCYGSSASTRRSGTTSTASPPRRARSDVGQRGADGRARVPRSEPHLMLLSERGFNTRDASSTRSRAASTSSARGTTSRASAPTRWCRRAPTC